MMKRLTLLLFTLLLLATDASFREAGAQEIDTNSPDMAWWREAQLTKGRAIGLVARGSLWVLHTLGRLLGARRGLERETSEGIC